MSDKPLQRRTALAHQRVLDAIETYIEMHGHSPTRAEIAALADMPEITVKRHVRALITEGRLIEGAGPRTLRINQ